jgi:hypothetical protein
MLRIKLGIEDGIRSVELRLDLSAVGGQGDVGGHTDGFARNVVGVQFRVQGYSELASVETIGARG